MGCILSKRDVIKEHNLLTMSVSSTGRFRSAPFLMRSKRKTNKTEYGGHRNFGKHR